MSGLSTLSLTECRSLSTKWLVCTNGSTLCKRSESRDPPLKSFFTSFLYRSLTIAGRSDPGGSLSSLPHTLMHHRPTQNLQPNLSRMLRRAQRALGEGELTKAERLYTELLQHKSDGFD